MSDTTSDDEIEPEYLIAEAVEEWVRTEYPAKDLLLLQSEEYDLGMSVRDKLKTARFMIERER